MGKNSPGTLLLAALACLAALSIGCASSRIPFTQELRDRHGLGDADVRRLQFYVSDTVTLRREITLGSREITPGHKLRLVAGRTIEEVVVEKGTPGVAVAVRGMDLRVSFEPGASILFSVEGAAPEPQPVAFASAPDPFPGNDGSSESPSLFAEGEPFVGEGRFFVALLPGGEVPYRRARYQIDEDGARAHLLIDAEALERVVETRKVLPGVRLRGAP